MSPKIQPSEAIPATQNLLMTQPAKKPPLATPIQTQQQQPAQSLAVNPALSQIPKSDLSF